MFCLLHQPTAGDPDRPPALVLMENSLPLFTPISFLLWLFLCGPYVFRGLLAKEQLCYLQSSR